MTAHRSAPAKVNLYLHVGAPGADRYHPLSSLVVFADLGDELRLTEADRFSFAVEGPFAEGLTAGADNLVFRAVDALAARLDRPMPPIALTLDKRLPVAAGLGGGSSDAAAALRLVRDHVWPDADEPTILDVLGEIGADGPMCWDPRPAIAEGRGDHLSPAPLFPDLPAVLVNPGVECSTGEVYRAYDTAGRFGDEARGVLRPAYGSAAELSGDLAGSRNDLEPVARALQPDVGEVLDLLKARSETLLARMSGSGATCFALCPTAADARRLCDSVHAAQPAWWVEPVVFGGQCA